MRDHDSPRRYVRDALTMAFTRVVGLASHRSALRLGVALGRTAAVCTHFKRRRMEDTLARAGAGDPARARLRAAAHLGRTAIEMCWLLTQRAESIDAITTVDGLDVLRDAVAEGRGVLLASAHLGNWELVARSAAQAGAPVAVIANSLACPRFEGAISAFRQSAGVATIVRGAPGASVGALRTLRRGGVLGCMMDRASRGRRLAVPFLGRAMRLPIGPMVLALRGGSPVVFGHTERDESGHVRVWFERLQLPDGADAEDATRVVGDAIEAAVVARPEQWYLSGRRLSGQADPIRSRESTTLAPTLAP